MNNTKWNIAVLLFLSVACGMGQPSAYAAAQDQPRGSDNKQLTAKVDDANAAKAEAHDHENNENQTAAGASNQVDTTLKAAESHERREDDETADGSISAQPESNGSKAPPTIASKAPGIQSSSVVGQPSAKPNESKVSGDLSASQLASGKGGTNLSDTAIASNSPPPQPVTTPGQGSVPSSMASELRQVPSDGGLPESAQPRTNQGTIAIESKKRDLQPLPAGTTADWGAGTLWIMGLLLSSMTVVLGWIALSQIRLSKDLQRYLSEHNTVPDTMPRNSASRSAPHSLEEEKPAAGIAARTTEPGRAAAALVGGAASEATNPGSQQEAAGATADANPSMTASAPTNDSRKPEWTTAFVEDLRAVIRAVIREELPQTATTHVPSNPSGAQATTVPTGRAPATAEVVDLTVIVAEAKNQEDTALARDLKEQSTSEQELRKWNVRIDGLREAVKMAAQSCGDMLGRAKQEMELLPATLRERLQGRQEALDLISKMMARLESTAPSAMEVTGKGLVSLDEGTLRAQLLGVTQEAAARELVRSKLKLGATERYQHVTQLRGAADKSRKAFLGFVTKQILPILDGLEEGERTSKSLIEDLKTSHADYAARLDIWFQSYAGPLRVLIELLERFEVIQMAVERGQVVNYERHEPFEVESDSVLKNEQVKSVVRHGYEYRGEGTVLILRAAQVIVVKN